MEQDPSHPSSEPLLVLVVNDNPVMRYATVRVLRGAGFLIREAENGAQALQAADEAVAAVILDIYLPDTDGFAVCKRMRQMPHLDSVPIIHLSAAFIEPQDKVRGLEGGADAYLTHPADPPLLVATVNALIRARRAERKLQRSEARFRGIFDMAHSGIALIDETGKIAECNHAFQTVLKRQHRDLKGLALSELVPADLHANVASHLRQARLESWQGEFPLLDAEGKLVQLAWSMSAHVEDGVVTAIATDVSDRLLLARQRQDLLEREQAARASAERASRSKGELVAVLSHELRTPLNAILTWGQLLQRSPAQLARGLEVIVRNANVQTRLISDILDISRLDIGKLRLDLTSVNFARVVHSAVEATYAQASDKAIQLDVRVQDLQRPLVVDDARLQQIVWNLLTNAIKFSEKGGRIWVTGRQSGDRVQLSVRDEGRGIDPKFLPFLFERFSQSDAASNRHHGGLGLGLSIVKQLVELHEGRVSVTSAGPGLGSVFEVDLPLAGPQVAARDEDPTIAALDAWTDRPGLADLQILLVEDDEDALDITVMVLKEHGAKAVSVARDAMEALASVKASWPDVVVSDIGLPGQDGYELARQIRQIEALGKPKVRLVALTAFSRPQDVELAMRSGFDVHCGKPLRPAELLAAIVGSTQ